MTNPNYKPFTVLALYPDNGQIHCTHVWARDGLHAFTQAAHAVAPEEGDYCDLDFVAALPGHRHEDADVFFPGEGVVDGETVLAQPAVFGAFSPEAPAVD